MIAVGDTRETIVAIASSPAAALRGIVRIAGDSAVEVLSRMAADFRPESHPRPTRFDVRLDLGEPLGELDCVALVWPSKRSYSGVPSVELHTWGAVPVLEAVVALAIRSGARPAGPGEFTMRAFLAGRLDLTQAEAVLGVIDATDRGQLDAALSQLAGNVSAPLRDTRDRLLNLLADLEAGLDFVDEEIEFIDDATIEAGLIDAADVIAEAASRITARHRGFTAADIVLRGAPNAGKSSLLNALAGRDVAIVSEIAGTTRDVVSHETAVAGHPVRLLDTAGIESVDDEISRQSQSAADESQRTAALTLQCVPWWQIDFDDPNQPQPARILVATQADRLPPSVGDSANAAGATREAVWSNLRRDGWTITSAVDGIGLDQLQTRIAEKLASDLGSAERSVSATAARCADSIRRAAESLAAGLDLIRQTAGHELVAGEIRLALTAIAEVTGEIYTDDILDRVFSRFCIGK